MEIEELYKIREMLHRYPELSGQEQATSQRVVQVLEALKPTHLHTGIGGYGVVAEYVFAEEGETLLFRADMDAIAVDEAAEIPYASAHPGVAHKCGHDGHTTILLAFADLLHRAPLRRGRVLLAFQPAEETGEGAVQMLEDPFFKSKRIDYAFALHNLPGYPAGAVVCREGSFTCSVVSCTVEVEGKTAHAAEPEKALSPTPLLLRLLREAEGWDCNQPGSAAYFRSTLIELHIGEEAYGVAAGRGLIRFTFRAATENLLRERMQELEDLIAAAGEQQPAFRIRLRWQEPFQANENHPEAAAFVRQAAADLQLPYVEATTPFAWGEDFGAFTQRYRGAMFGLGAGEHIAPLHSPGYDFPNAIINDGARLFYRIAERIVQP